MLMLSAFSIHTFAQADLEKAQTYFSKYIDAKAFQELSMKSLPTLADCKLVFKDSSAIIYYNFIENMKKKHKEDTRTDTNTFVDMWIESFTTTDIKLGNKKYAGGMKKIEDKFQKDTTFYQVNMLRTKGAALGVAFNYWVYINGHWVFFFKPWWAFK